MHILDDGYVLNKRPFKNTSAIVHYFTREHGIICLVAKGAKKVTKGLCVNLEQFILQKIYFIPKASLGILVRQELFIKEKYIDSSLLFVGLYVNEIILKLLAEGDSHPQAFDAYSKFLDNVSVETLEKDLRIFEFKLLEDIGYGINFKNCTNGHEISENETFKFIPGEGFVKTNQTADIDGKTILNIGNNLFTDESLKIAKIITRCTIQGLIPDIKSKNMFKRLNNK